MSVISYEAAVLEVYSNKALQNSPAYAAYEVEGDELAGDLSSFALANAIYAGLVEGHASEVGSPRPRKHVKSQSTKLTRALDPDFCSSQRHGQRFKEL